MTYRLDKEGKVVDTTPDSVWDKKPGVVDTTWLGDGSPESLTHAQKCRDIEAGILREGKWMVIDTGPCRNGPDGPVIGYYLNAWRSQAAHERWRARAGR